MTRRPALAAAAIYALLAVAFLGQALFTGRTLSNDDYFWSAAPWAAQAPAHAHGFGSNPELVDPVTQFEPFMRYTRSHLPDVPLWDPYVMGGRPFVGNGQSAVFSPYSVPSYVLPFRQSLAVSQALKLFIAAFGTFLLARALGMRFAGALLAGLVYAFGLFMVAWLPWPLSSVWSWIPWLMLLADRVVRRPGPLPAAGLAAVVALQFVGGHIESSFHTLVATALFFLLRLGQRWRAEGRRAIVRPALTGAGSLVLGTAVAAAALAPLTELLLRSADLTARSASGPVVVPRKFLVGLLLSDYWGRPTQTPLGGFLVERAFYVGALTLVLAGAALILRPAVERIFFALLGLLALAIVVGVHPVTVVVQALPGFHAAYNTRLTIVFVLAAGLLAGWGLDELTRHEIHRAGLWRRRGVVGLAGGLLAAPFVLMAARGELLGGRLGDGLRVAWGFAHPPAASVPAAASIVRMGALLEWLPFGLAALALVAVRLRGRLPAATFATLAVAVVALDLFRAGMGENPAIPVARATQPTTGAIRYLRSRRPQRFVGLPPVTGGAVPLPPNVSIDLGLYDARGYDFPVYDRYNALWRRAVVHDPGFAPPAMLATTTPLALRGMSLLGVSDLVQSPKDAPLHVRGLRLAYNRRDARIYANPAAMPRAAVVGAARVVGPDRAALSAVLAPGFRPRSEAVVDRPVAGLPATPAAGPAGTARVVRLQPDSVVVRASAARRSLLVLDDVAYPGWQATVDGRPAPIVRTDYLLRGVPIGPGAHTVAFAYRPASWRAGWIVSVIGLVVLAALVAYGVARHRRTARARYSSRS